MKQNRQLKKQTIKLVNRDNLDYSNKATNQVNPIVEGKIKKINYKAKFSTTQILKDKIANFFFKKTIITRFP